MSLLRNVNWEKIGEGLSHVTQAAGSISAAANSLKKSSTKQNVTTSSGGSSSGGNSSTVLTLLGIAALFLLKGR